MTLVSRKNTSTRRGRAHLLIPRLTVGPQQWPAPTPYFAACRSPDATLTGGESTVNCCPTVIPDTVARSGISTLVKAVCAHQEVTKVSERGDLISGGQSPLARRVRRRASSSTCHRCHRRPRRDRSHGDKMRPQPHVDHDGRSICITQAGRSVATSPLLRRSYTVRFGLPDRRSLLAVDDRCCASRTPAQADRRHVAIDSPGCRTGRFRSWRTRSLMPDQSNSATAAVSPA